MQSKRLAATLVMGSALSVSLIGLAAPANAALSQCGKGLGCMWTEPTYGSDFSGFGSNLNLNESRNRISSVANMGYAGAYDVARFYDGLNYEGPNIAMYEPLDGRQSRDPDLRNGIVGNGESWDNRIESGAFRNY